LYTLYAARIGAPGDPVDGQPPCTPRGHRYSPVSLPA
jgi:hypothetical protein